eukprot:CAMPEP_0194043030 /NCGR_PEP_ID=MMETSP0009_2-20130614/14731_1 /TAXON_ID=210454 /ORGANISM="Grammatophora oceanica, Strain CCMP 410" /LENGTH=221 /DNA_ID=CAMNT_0038687105 /DNA_START=84 /DNA_END=749 /DNA_ORIENTATION=-
MAPLLTKFVVVVIASSAGVAAAFRPASTFVRPSTQVKESFGFDFAEDSYENTPEVILGEANYKQWVNKIEDNSFLNRKYNALRRVNELDLLGATADAGILSKLEKQGLDLETIEKLLPLAEQFGLLSLVANNQQILLNGVAPLLVEPAPLLLPIVAGALDVGPPAFFLAAGGCAGLEALLLANNVELPFVGLSAGVTLGLLLVPLTVVFGGVGVALGNLKK